MAPRLVVTLPPSLRGAAALNFAREVKRRGAQLLEVRTDLHAEEDVNVQELAQELPLLVSERVRPLPTAWVVAASRADIELPTLPKRESLPHAPLLISHHAEVPLSPKEALARWTAAGVPDAAWVKHVEPLGPPAKGERLFETQRLLVEHFGKERVTVLGMGALALPFRCLLARRNVLDYVAADGVWAAASGQRLLADAVRERKGRPTTSRAGIIGSGIGHSRSPRIHPQPFDRIDLPEDAPVGELVDALVPYYRGFAVTSPFKKVVAAHLGVPLAAVNTLVRRGHSYDADNTDVEGAKKVFARLGPGQVTVLGDGGATEALRLAANAEQRPLRVLRRADDYRAPVTGLCVWTWPPSVPAPDGLRFERSRVAVIAYGPPGRVLSDEVKRRGGVPLMLGASWLIAQARGQRRLWEAGT